jgi:alpha-L-fucosidase 2
MQSSDGAIHLLPALPDAWPDGKVQGLRAKGGFEIVDMQWEKGILIKVVIKSNLGGRMQLRVPNALKLSDGKPLQLAIGKNKNPFYQVDEVSAPVISQNARITPPTLKETRLYEVATERGGTLTMVPE